MPAHEKEWFDEGAEGKEDVDIEGNTQLAMLHVDDCCWEGLAKFVCM